MECLNVIGPFHCLYRECLWPRASRVIFWSRRATIRNQRPACLASERTSHPTNTATKSTCRRYKPYRAIFDILRATSFYKLLLQSLQPPPDVRENYAHTLASHGSAWTARGSRNHTTVSTVEKVLITEAKWLDICGFTLAKNPTSVITVENVLVIAANWLNICGFTLAKNPTSVITVVNVLV